MKALPRYHRPLRRLNAVGARAQRQMPTRRAVYAEVTKRAHGCCEVCGLDWERLADEPLDPHHPFGRGHLGGIPARYCEVVVIAICHDLPATGHHGCHERIHDDGDEALIGAAQGKALAVFAERYGLQRKLAELLTSEWSPLEIMRGLCRTLEDREAEEGVS